MAKLSKRDRYVLKWNGPYSVQYRKTIRRRCRAEMGHGDETTRTYATAFMFRFRGKPLPPIRVFYRAVGVVM